MIRRASSIAGVLAAIALPSLAAADPVVTTSATITGGVAYERNPFLYQGSDTGAASAQIEVRPRIGVQDERTSGSIEAFYNRSQYFSKYKGNDAAGVAIGTAHRLNSRWSLSTGAAFSSSIIGANNGFGVARDALATLVPVTPTPTPPAGTVAPPTDVIVPTTPGAVVPGVGTGLTDVPVVLLPGGDVGLIGLRQRTNTLSASVGATYQPNERSTWTFAGSAQRQTYPGDQTTIFAADYNSYAGTIGYNRLLNENMTIGLRGSVSYTDYDVGSTSTVYSPQGTIALRLSQRWSLDAAVGASFVQRGGVEIFGGGSGTSLNAQINLCQNSERSTLCLFASRAPNVTGFQGVTTSTSAGASYTRRLSELSSISLAANYTETNFGTSTLMVGNWGDQRFWTATGSYARRITQRLSAVATAQYRDADYSRFSPKADISGRIGVSVAVGDVR